MVVAGRPEELPGAAPRPDPSRAREAEDGLHLLWGEGQSAIHVLFQAPGSGAAPVAQLTLDAAALERIEALARFWRAHVMVSAPPDSRLTPGRRRRLGQMLRAVDARHEGASYREIAEALFGSARVADEPWKTSPLRDTTIRLARDGRAFADGGYRRLLRRR